MEQQQQHHTSPTTSGQARLVGQPSPAASSSSTNVTTLITSSTSPSSSTAGVGAGGSALPSAGPTANANANAHPGSAPAARSPPSNNNNGIVPAATTTNHNRSPSSSSAVPSAKPTSASASGAGPTKATPTIRKKRLSCSECCTCGRGLLGSSFTWRQLTHCAAMLLTLPQFVESSAACHPFPASTAATATSQINAVHRRRCLRRHQPMPLTSLASTVPRRLGHHRLSEGLKTKGQTRRTAGRFASRTTTRRERQQTKISRQTTTATTTTSTSTSTKTNTRTRARSCSPVQTSPLQLFQS